MEKEISLDKYIDKAKRDLELFRDWWLKSRKEHILSGIDEYPLCATEGQWEEQFYQFNNSNNEHRNILPLKNKQ